MKTTATKHDKTIRENRYPYLGINKAGSIVYFIGGGGGALVHKAEKDGDYELADDSFDEDEFAEYSGTVTLTND